MSLQQSHTDSDRYLLEQYQLTHNQQWLAKLYLKYYSLVFGTCLKYLEDTDAAKDAVMNIYQELVLKVPQHQIEHFSGWLHTVARNHCLMALRKQKRTPTVSFDASFMQNESFEHLDVALEKEQQLTALENCIEQLQAQQQQAIRLFYLEQKNYHEVAELTGFEWAKVRSLIQNGRRNLKICLEKNEAE
ncbi:MAG TPA: RNA polymerase subunit sigma-70 [Chitinophagaceae bacterium]|nr:RNA polymerase subunit sigma-70 [Chitinophagaceae bacterium]